MENIFKQVNCPSIIKITHSYPISVALALDQSVGDILGVGASACVNSAECSSGLAKVKAVALFNILYKEDGKILSYESSADLAFEVSDSKISANSLVDLRLCVKNAQVSKGEKGLELTAEIYAECYFNRVQAIPVLEDIEGAIVKKEEIKPLSFVKCINATAQIDGEKRLAYFVERVICHSESARVLNSSVSHDEVILEGEILSEVLLLKQNGERVSEKIVTPFRYEIDCEGAMPNEQACMNACINRAGFKIASDEAGNSANISCEYSLLITGMLTEQTPVNCVIDGFSVLNELTFDSEGVELVNDLAQAAIKHKHFGEGDISLGAKESIVASVFCTVDDLAVKKVSEDKVEISGVAGCLVIVKNEAGELYGERVFAPVLLTADCKHTPVCVSAQTQGVVARNLDGKCLLELELVFTLTYMQSETRVVLVNAIFGEEKEQKSSAFSVVFIDKGDDLWTVCKKALASEQAILADNPDMVFPAKQEKAVVVYNKLKY